MSTDPSPQMPSQMPRSSQVCLGLFVCWQLWFLLSQNLCKQLESWQEAADNKTSPAIEAVAPQFGEGKGHVFDAVKWVRHVNQPWEHATGQLQLWSLFPDGYHDLIFAAFAFRWDDDDGGDYPATDVPEPDGTIVGRPYKLFLSPHEPADIAAYFRNGKMRSRRYETSMVFALRSSASATDAERKRAWNDRIKDHMHKNGDWLFAYLKVRTREILAEHPELPPPKRVVMLMRRYHTRPPEETPPDWDGPFVAPLASWTPTAPGEAGQGTTWRFDPELDRFRRIE